MRVSAYETTDGLLFRDRQKAKEHTCWLDLVELAKAIPIPSTGGTESAEAVELQRAGWLLANADAIRKLAKHACDHGNDGAALELPPE